MKHLLEDDANTRYYHLLANGRHRKTRIFQLEDGDNIITGDAQLKQHITSYYKNLFGPSEVTLISLDELQTEDIPQVSDLENEFLTAPFTEEEVKLEWRFSKWNTTRLLAQMVFLWNFIKFSRVWLKMI